MAGKIGDRVMDNGLTVLDTEATDIVLCASEPDPATSTTFLPGNANVLGRKNWGAGNAFGTPASSSTPPGQKVSSIAITDGAGTNNGTANWWAAIDNGNSRLLAHGSISNPQAITNGGVFTLPSFDVILPSGA